MLLSAKRVGATGFAYGLDMTDEMLELAERNKAEAGAANAIVFEALRGWRRETAKEHGVPAYTIFHDSTLQELAGKLPGSLEELRDITGIGATKLERYGTALLDVMQRATT